MLARLMLALLPLVLAGPPYAMPTAKRVVKEMDGAIISLANTGVVMDLARAKEAMAPYWTRNLVYDSVLGIGKDVGFKQWYNGEWSIFFEAFDTVRFNQLIFLGEENTGTTTTYANARWSGEFAGQEPTFKAVSLRICDFYRLDPTTHRIETDWMMMDLPDLLRQSGRRVLPEAPVLRDDGWFQPPRALDGIPAPFSPLTHPETAEKSRRVAQVLLNRDWFETGGDDLWAQDMLFYGPAGIGFATNHQEYHTEVLGPLRRGLTNRSFALDLLTCEGAYCGAHGYLYADHTGCFLGEAATGRRVALRVALHWHIEDGVALEGYAMFDSPELFKQLGVNLLGRTAAPPACAVPTLLALRPPPAEYLPVAGLAAASAALAALAVAPRFWRRPSPDLEEALLA